MSKIRLAIIGCGYVADLYMQNIQNYPSVTLVRAFDIEPAHAERFTRYWKVPNVTSQEALFDGLQVDTILNLTNPVSHFEIDCTLEHAGYYLTWLVALFGSVTEVHAFSSLRFPINRF